MVIKKNKIRYSKNEMVNTTSEPFAVRRSTLSGYPLPWCLLVCSLSRLDWTDRTLEPLALFTLKHGSHASGHGPGPNPPMSRHKLADAVMHVFSNCHELMVRSRRELTPEDSPENPRGSFSEDASLSFGLLLVCRSKLCLVSVQLGAGRAQ